MAKKLTKAQQVQAEAEVRETAVRAALAWPDYPAPTPMSGKEMDARVEAARAGGSEIVWAWTYNAHTGRVTYGCFNHVHHETEGAKTTTQTRGGPWFDTQEDAYRALRWTATRRLAEELLTLDEHMSREMAGRSPI